MLTVNRRNVDAEDLLMEEAELECRRGMEMEASPADGQSVLSLTFIRIVVFIINLFYIVRQTG